MPTAGPAKKVWALPHDVLRDAGETVYVGGAVEAELVLVERDDVVVLARHFSAYPEGFAFVLHIWVSEPDENLFDVAETLQHNPRRGGKQDREHVYLRVELPDGTSVTGFYNGLREPWLELYNAWGHVDHYEGELVAPVAIPESGPLTLIFDWAARGIVDARATIDSALLSQAAHDARALFAVADRP